MNPELWSIGNSYGILTLLILHLPVLVAIPVGMWQIVSDSQHSGLTDL